MKRHDITDISISLFDYDMNPCVKLWPLTSPYKPHTGRTGHAPAEKGTVDVNILTVNQYIQLRNSLQIV